MKIGVLIKHVPDTESVLSILPDGSGIDTSHLRWVMNAYDEIAVEEAIRLKEREGGEVVVFTLGAKDALETVRRAIAMGADRGVWIDSDGASLPPAATAHVLALACKQEACDIIFAGKIATDDGYGQVHIGVAEHLGWPHISPIERFVFNADAKTVTVMRCGMGSLKQTVEAELPIVLGCEKGLNEPRFLSIKGMMMAKSKPVQEFSYRELAPEESCISVSQRYRTVPEKPAGRMLPGTPVEAAMELVRCLRDEAKVLS